MMRPSTLPRKFIAALAVAPQISGLANMLNFKYPMFGGSRSAGPRLDVERVGDKTVVHNYGHGGSGWSLSWGSSSIAVEQAMATGERNIAVIGCGALGLTSAILLQRAGAKVTIYAKERPPDVRSARATGSWTPDSRVALTNSVSPDFPALREKMCRNSFHTGVDPDFETTS